MSSGISNYDDLLEELRLRYKRKYNKLLDDEILYIIIRLNELQMDQKNDFQQLKRAVASKPKLAFSFGKDYFFYGLGQATGTLIMWLISLFISLMLVSLLLR
jgi:hypothetical protein